MSDLGTLYGGLTGKSGSDFVDGNAAYVSYMNVFTSLRARATSSDRFKLRPGERQNRIARGDVLFTISSESRKDSGMASAVVSEPSEPTYLNSFCFGFRPVEGAGLDPEFSKYLFRSSAIREQIVRAANGVTRFNISRASFLKTRVPVPPLAEQRRIAEVLDKFDALVNDLSSGLPAEIAARRQQYEYYRDRLLIFEEARS